MSSKRKKLTELTAVARATKSKASFQLAINIIEEQFGPMAKIVAEVMSRFDNMKLKEIVKEIKKTHPKSEVSKQKNTNHDTNSLGSCNLHCSLSRIIPQPLKKKFMPSYISQWSTLSA